MIFSNLGLQQMDLNVDFFSPLKQLRYLNLANCSFYLMPLNLFENNTKLNELRSVFFQFLWVSILSDLFNLWI
jgi:hypothetical protein